MCMYTKSTHTHTHTHTYVYEFPKETNWEVFTFQKESSPGKMIKCIIPVYKAGRGMGLWTENSEELS